ncbi:MAG TPA: hypothetical protein PLX02_07960 [Syntrophorhabdaceae bacterium]|nr:hypothetical protein [Syntrophorhabdaceae bacterium]HQM81537.1 hypothetical protein [Syntrophorhabdaceae bacterium]
MKIIVAASIVFFIFGCAGPGPVHIATTESDSIESTYKDPRVESLHQKNSDLIRDIYWRLIRSNVGIYRRGIGITTLTDQHNEQLHYLKVNIRPSDVYFDENTTKPEDRFSHVLMTAFPKYLKFIKSSDLDRDDIEGLAFGIYWPVRDYSQCNTFGGFIEYIHIYFRKNDAQDILEGRLLYADSLKGDVEIMTSLNLQPAKSVRPVF